MDEINQYWENKKEFLKRYSQIFLPYIKCKNDDIKNTVHSYNFYKKSIFLCFLAIVFFVIGIFLWISFNYRILADFIGIFFVVFIAGLLLLMLLFKNSVSKYRSEELSLNILKNEIKKNLMPIFCECFNNLKWDNAAYKNPEIFSMGEFSTLDKDKIKIDDVFYGINKGILFDIIEIYTKDKNNNQEVSFNHWESICIRIKTDKKFNSNTYILPKNKGKNTLQTLINNTLTQINIFIGKLCGLNLEELSKLDNDFHFTNLEDVVFQKKFDVYTDDDVEARYLITPAFMQRIANIEKKFNSQIQRVEFCWGRELLIFLKTKKDCFELFSTDNKTDNKDVCFKIFDEIASIYSLIDFVKTSLVFDVKVKAEPTKAQITQRNKIYSQVQIAKSRVSNILKILSTTAILIVSLAEGVMKSLRHSHSDLSLRISVVAFIVASITGIFAGLFALLKKQLDKQTDRFEYMMMDK